MKQGSERVGSTPWLDRGEDREKRAGTEIFTESVPMMYNGSRMEVSCLLYPLLLVWFLF